MSRRFCFMMIFAFSLIAIVVSAEAGALPKDKKIAVVIYENTSDLSKPGLAVGSAESIVMQTLLQNGYKIVNQKQLDALKRSKAAMLALDGNVDAIMGLGKQYSVQIFVSGKASIHEPVINEFGTYTGTAAISVQAYSASNGQYLFADTVTAKELGYSSDEAGQKALMAAAKLMGQNLVQGAGSGGSSGGLNNIPATISGLYIVVTGVTNFNTANALLDACTHLTRSKSARINSYSGGVLILGVDYLGSAQELADAIRNKGLPIMVTGVSGTTVNAEAR